MNTVGIIAEYNPFHNGHCYHLSEAKRQSRAEYAVCVMSGHFVQRGEPAIVNKWSRAEMALRNGADLVLELPALYATRSAYWFAKGGIATLEKTGVVTHLAFGVEKNGGCGELLACAKTLADESPLFQDVLKKRLKTGLSYPKARALALEEQGYSKVLLERPNNVLALAYLQVLSETKSRLQPVAIERVGSLYNETNLREGVYPSATALREILLRKGFNIADAAQQLSGFMPASAVLILIREFRDGRGPVSADSLDLPLMTLLRRSRADDLKNIIDVTEGLENRIVRNSLETCCITHFLDSLKTKRYTHSRLRRFLIHLLLNYTRQHGAALYDGPPYLRVLGFNAGGELLLRKMKESARAPVIVKSADAQKHLKNQGLFQLHWDMDIAATNLYTLLYPAVSARKGNADYYTSPVRV